MWVIYVFLTEGFLQFKELKNKRDEFEVKILIHSSMAGAIIGKFST